MDRPPLERQFFDYFRDRCDQAMQAEVGQSLGRDVRSDEQMLMADYCACTAQAVVSRLDAAQLVLFAVDPEQEPVASLMRPAFIACQHKLSR